MAITIRPATRADETSMLALLPRLADFDVPAVRNPNHLWESDRDLLLGWLSDPTDQVIVAVAVTKEDQVIGVSIVSLREELLSHEPSAHLEVLAVANEAEGMGVGAALIRQAEDDARARGALSMSLHVFANNKRARRLYEKSGFDGELMRYYKPL